MGYSKRQGTDFYIDFILLKFVKLIYSHKKIFKIHKLYKTK